MKKPKIIDFNKLVTVIVDGEDSYEDGRYSFGYELLTRTLAEAGITINRDAVRAEMDRRGKVRYARNRARMFDRKVMQYVITLEGDWSVHFPLIFKPGSPQTPWDVREEYVELDPENFEGPTRWTYMTTNRTSAAKLLGYIRAVHPDARNLRLTKEAR